MSSRVISKATTATIIVANDLSTGRTVYLGKDGLWHPNTEKVRVLTDNADAQSKLRLCEQDPDVIGPYLVKTDAQGKPEHIREVIRLRGPSIYAVNMPITEKGESCVSV
ncbi:MAG: DUF2849 domain-containing protein [Granulosicoccus sp.]|nr:DUF2849 domain-containing protein [Granulosicoccus sp.]